MPKYKYHFWGQISHEAIAKMRNECWVDLMTFDITKHWVRCLYCSNGNPFNMALRKYARFKQCWELITLLRSMLPIFRKMERHLKPGYIWGAGGWYLSPCHPREKRMVDLLGICEIICSYFQNGYKILIYIIKMPTEKLTDAESTGAFR